MNLIVLTEHDFITGSQAVLRDERFIHIRDVLHAAPGSSIRVGKLNGLIGTATISSMSTNCATLQTRLEHSPPDKLPVTIILALPRPKMIRRIFFSIAELGIRELIVINSYKVEKSFWQSPVLDKDNIQHYLVQGLQQAKDTVLPRVRFASKFKPFVEDELPDICSSTHKLVAHPGTGHACPHSINKPVTLAIGPEGGFTEYEIAKLTAVGFETIHLGPRILRVENALTALTSKLFD